MKFGIIAIALTTAIVAGSAIPSSHSITGFPTCNDLDGEPKKLCTYLCNTACDAISDGDKEKICMLACAAAASSHRPIDAGVGAKLSSRSRPHKGHRGCDDIPIYEKRKICKLLLALDLACAKNCESKGGKAAKDCRKDCGKPYKS
ncbi:hypothetical protein Ptr902_09739 [Pyrenophora tritici-repentis]|uniref:Uncharacterized protein n=1 Tax=Pyrenophora tritici-repentis TaxID=45151 RepID=A0A5M9KW79_9PLEO|nr:hypothetical protein PtrV1_11573 [Pyrenophora tritici-repentis]KAF7444376.1 hypothetical protein A1F99_109290 [Pyrenophora tritici-repentis]KAF7564972.1 hypothetical protein PtrM4_044060 [Pyrenophora tritici-repentis]KAI0578836.1 hypothetical protein Alg130_07768 [Pyrenophora tritici-repentis]KAI0586143.1 hypothetical protein Alg215_02195 [Pyrenophora tritici-repentis]